MKVAKFLTTYARAIGAVGAILTIVALGMAIWHMKVVEFLTTYAPAIGAVGAILTIVALGMAIWQTIDLKSIANALPTRDIGSFPEYVARISELIRTAKKRIVIVCDAPCYCIFSDRNLWTEYESAIKQARDKFVRDNRRPSICITWMDPTCRIKVLEEQFKPDRSPEATQKEKNSWKKDIKDELDTFLKVEPGVTTTADSITYDDFAGIVERAHERMIAGVNPVEVRWAHRSLELYFWIIDDEAIFAIPNYKDRGKGRGFWTRDKSIVDGLQIISDRLPETEKLEQRHSA